MGLAQINIRFKADLKQFSTEMQNVGREMEKIGSKMQAIGATMTAAITLPLVAIGAAAYNMAADFEDAMGATNQVFKDAADSTMNWANALPTYYGIAKKEALEYSNMMGSMLVNIGNLTEQEAAKQSSKLIELAGDLTAMYGGTTADAVRALTGALKGNNTMLDNYGMAANDAMVKTKAMEMGLLKQGQTMDLATKQAATLALIYEQSAAAQGQAAREADGASGSMRALKTELTNVATEFGQHLLPIITPIVQGLRDMMERFRDLDPEMKKIIVIGAGVLAAIGPLLAIFGTFAAMLPSIIAGISSMGAGFAALSGPVGWVIAGVAALIALMVKNWQPIKKVLIDTANYFIDLYNESIIFRHAVESVIATFKLLGNIIGLVFNVAGTILSGFWNNLKNMVSTLGSFIKAILTGDFSAIPKIISENFTKGVDTAKGVWNDFKKDISSFKTDVSKTFDTAVSNTLNKKHKLIGENVDTTEVEEKVTKEVADSTVEGVNAGIDKVNASGKTVKVKVETVQSLSPLSMEPKFGKSESDYDAEIAKLRELRYEAALGTSQWAMYDMQLQKLEEEKRIAIDSSGVQSATDSLDALQNRMQAVLDDMAQRLKERTENISAVATGVSNGINSAFSIMGEGIVNSLGEAENGMDRFNQEMIKTVTKVIGMALSRSIAMAIVGGTESGAATGPGAIVAIPTMIATLVSGVIGAFAAIPKFANGGIVSGPTLGLMGEYTGAANNPEVIAPLNKLKDLINPTGGATNVTVQLAGGWRVQGNDLITVLDRVEKINQRKR